MVEAWVAAKEHRDCVLIVMFDQPKAGLSQPNAALAYLSMLARRYGLDFFEQTVAAVEEDPHTEKLELVGVL